MKKFSAAFAGIVKGLQHRAVATQFLLGTLALAAAFVLHLNSGEWIAVVICIGMVISSEMLNTCIEKLCDLYSEQYDARIALIKDMAAGAVLTASLAALVTALIILAGHI